VHQLERLIAEDEDIEVRVEAMLALADGGAEESLELLVKMGRAGVPRVRQIAILALGELAPPEMTPAIDVALEAVESALPALRYQGLVALRALKQADAVELLLSRTADEDAEVRWVAVRLLDELWFPKAATEARSPAIGVGNGTHVEQLRPLLRDKSPRVAVAATLLLSRLGDRSAIDRLPALLLRGPYRLEQQDEEAAIEIVGQLGLEIARAELERRAWSWLREGPVTWCARVALAQLGDTKARRAILQSLYSNSPLKCARAIEATGRIGLEEGRARLQALLAIPSAYDPDTIRTALQRLDRPSLTDHPPT
jgi:HEAT repeat protein